MADPDRPGAEAPVTSPRPSSEAGDAAEALKAVSGAVSARAGPSKAEVTTKPDRLVIWGMALAGPAVSVMLIALQLALVFIFWPDAVALRYVSVMTDIVRALALLSAALAAILGLIIFRLASGGLKSVSAKAGPAELEIETKV